MKLSAQGFDSTFTTIPFFLTYEWAQKARVFFRIGVTFEMRTAIQSDVFIQLITTHKIKPSYIRNGRGGKGQDSGETERESEGERMSIGRQRV